jgi:nitrogen regulatory protein P-II 1
MYLLKANIPADLVTELSHALVQLGLFRLRVAEISGYTDGIEEERVYRGTRYAIHLVPEVELEALVPNDSLDEAVDIVMRTIRRVQHGDGFISVAPLAHCYRVSTGNPQV